MIEIKQFFIITVFILSCNFAYSKDKVQTVLILKEWEPYYSLDKNGKPTGYAIELFEALAKDAGIKYQYKIFDNWVQMTPYRKSGKHYIIPNTGIVKGRSDYTNYSDTTDTFQIKYFKRASSFQINSKSDLAGRKVAVVKDNVCERLVKQKSIKRVLYKDYLRALSDLLSGEVDGMCYPKPLLEAALRNLYLSEKVVSFGKPLKEVKRGVGFSLNNAHLIPKFNNSLEKLKQNRTYERIYKKWFVQKERLEFTYEELVLLTAAGVLAVVILIFMIYYLSRRKKWLLTQHELEKQVREKTSKFYSLYHDLQEAQKISKMGSWSLDPNNDLLKWSDETYNIFGIDKTKSAISYEVFLNAVHHSDRDAVDKAYKNSLETRHPYVITHRLLMNDGRVKWVHERCRTDFDKDGNPLLSIGTIQDITEKHLYEEEIRAKKEEFETIFKSVRDGIAIIDLDTRFLNCNESFLELTGFTKEEILTKTCRELTVEEDKKKNDEAIKHAIEKGPLENIEKRCISKNGKIFTANMGISLLPDKKRILLTIKDMTAFKSMEEQSKLASMGEMIGNIAHQWRQPLSIITTSASGLDLKADLEHNLTKEDIKTFSNMIVEQANYLSKTIDDFKNFIKGDESCLQISVKEALNESLNLTDASRRDNYINLITDIKDDLEIKGNKNELVQSFINILNNAKDVLVKKDKSEQRYIFISSQKTADNTLEIKISDNGGGIKEDIIDKIFEPYFTTKHQSIGTGLGLSMADKIIRERHKGTVSAHNEEFDYDNKHHKGACFTILFKDDDKAIT